MNIVVVFVVFLIFTITMTGAQRKHHTRTNLVVFCVSVGIFFGLRYELYMLNNTENDAENENLSNFLFPNEYSFKIDAMLPCRRA